MKLAEADAIAVRASELDRSHGYIVNKVFLFTRRRSPGTPAGTGLIGWRRRGLR